jgi:bifunctional UDP-N-acetylglucosamine pyrophosphorylase/glucosamine-1-phosphate N-acetyltransferase
MRSSRPKVLHAVGGKAMIDLVVDACRQAGVQRVIVVANPTQPEVAERVSDRCEIVLQGEPLGTGHALALALTHLDGGTVFVSNGDVPLLRDRTVQKLIDAHQAAGSAASVGSVIDPTRNDGRVLRRADGILERIVEAKDASPEELRITEINAGLYCFENGPELAAALAALRPDNAGQERYLTDVFSRLRPARVVQLEDADEVMAVKDRVRLARAEQLMRRRILEELMLTGVTIVDPNNTYIDAEVTVGEDSVIEPGTHLRGRTRVGRGSRIGPNADVADSEIGDGCRVEHSWLRDCSLGDGSDCGPYAKLRRNTRIGRNVHIGSYVEVVRTSIGDRSAVAHFSYLGDATIGEGVNIGAGTVTANLDKRTGRKAATVVGDGAFIGVDSMLVAPVSIGKEAQTGAGAVVTKDVPDGALAVGVPARVIRRRAEVP